MILPIAPGTYLENPDEPSFVIGVPSIPTGPVTKPFIDSPMLGPLVEFINNFWPFWDVETGESVADIILSNNGVISGNLTWQPAKYGQGVGGAAVLGIDKIVFNPITLIGAWSTERLVSMNGVWSHEILVNDVANNLSNTYVNGVLQSSTTSNPNPVVINDMVAWTGEAVVDPFIIEFARVWNRALTSYEVTDLYGNPYIMFGMTQEILDEITTIVNFMKPMRVSWRFIEQ